jgi:hypothetical protein
LSATVLAGCGGSGLQGTLAWKHKPAVFTRPGSSSHSVAGFVRNTTSHAVDLDARQMRLLDADGRKVTGRIQLRSAHLPAGASTALAATWRSGKPVRIDYGAGALALPSP